MSVEVEGLNQVGDALFLALKMRGKQPQAKECS